MTEQQLLFGLVALAVILVIGRASAQIATRLGQPEVLGELVGGFLLGPSVFGALLPGVRHVLFLNPGVGLVLSGFSWIGAILLLFIAGFEVDLGILRREAKPGAFGAAFAIIPSLAAGTLFAVLAFHRPLQNSFFLGIVLSVTAVSVAAKVLMERSVLRRSYA
ncbi:MAG: cation:proton antiporter, partial [Chloroflexota bacterium]|nr:cation:proton antiporter [Chloroflexota bacterium]